VSGSEGLAHVAVAAAAALWLDGLVRIACADYGPLVDAWFPPTKED